MIDCDRALELISESLDGPLSPEDQKELDEHLAGCGACRALLSDFRQMHTALGDLNAPVPEGFARGVMEQVHREKVVPISGRRRWKNWAATAAVFAVVLLSAGTLGQDYLAGLTGNANGGSAPAAVPEEDEAGSGGETTSDGQQGRTGSAAPAETDSGVQERETNAASGGGGSAASGGGAPVNDRASQPESVQAAPEETAEAGSTASASPTPAATPATRAEVSAPAPTPSGAEPSPAPLTEEKARAVLEDYLAQQQPVAAMLTAVSKVGEITATGLSPNGAYYTFQVEEAVAGPDGETANAYAVSLDGALVLVCGDRSLLADLTPEDPAWADALAAYEAGQQAYYDAIGQ